MLQILFRYTRKLSAPPAFVPRDPSFSYVNRLRTPSGGSTTTDQEEQPDFFRGPFHRASAGRRKTLSRVRQHQQVLQSILPTEIFHCKENKNASGIARALLLE